VECLRELAQEYWQINTMLDVLDASVDRLNHHRYVDPQMWHGILRFFREFFHGCHYAKVDVLIVPLIAQTGTVPEVEETALLQPWYESGCALLETLAHLCPPRPEPTIMIEAMTTTTRQYVGRSRRLVPVERSLVEGFLTRVLVAADDERLVAEFKRLEREHIGPTGREWYSQLVLDYRDIVATWSHGPAS
jgi:hemerythrin-like domain-containing protein